MTMLYNNGLKVPKVFTYGKHEGSSYQITEFIEGFSGEQLRELPVETQYKIGFEAGTELKQFHQLSSEVNDDVYDRFKVKAIRLVKAYKDLNYSFEKEKEVINYISSHLYLLKGRMSKHLHGDFHPENMAFDEHGYNGVYDFERDEVEDYVRDFERTFFFTSDYSKEYVKGFIAGYEFEEFDVLKFYLSVAIISSFVWSFNHYPEQLEMFDRLAHQLLSDFKDFKGIKPNYLE